MNAGDGFRHLFSTLLVIFAGNGSFKSDLAVVDCNLDSTQRLILSELLLQLLLLPLLLLLLLLLSLGEITPRWWSWWRDRWWWWWW